MVGGFQGFRISIDRNSTAGSSQEETLLKTEQQFRVQAQLAQGPKDAVWSIRGPVPLLGGFVFLQLTVSERGRPPSPSKGPGPAEC